MIPQKDWKWFGMAAHFICANDCRFRMATQVGDVMVSTVGGYRPGRCETNQEIGYQRTYETMVFALDGVCDVPGCWCGMPMIVPTEVEMTGYNSAAEANRGHLDACMRWAEADGKAPEQD